MGAENGTISRLVQIATETVFKKMDAVTIKAQQGEPCSYLRETNTKSQFTTKLGNLADWAQSGRKPNQELISQMCLATNAVPIARYLYCPSRPKTIVLVADRKKKSFSICLRKNLLSRFADVMGFSFWVKG